MFDVIFDAAFLFGRCFEHRVRSDARDEVLAKVGRTISAKNEATLRTAVESLDSAAKSIKSVLAALDSGSGDDGDKAAEPSSASDTGPAKDEEPEGAKSEEPNRRTSSAATWEAQLNLTELEGTTHAY